MHRPLPVSYKQEETVIESGTKNLRFFTKNKDKQIVL